MADQPIKSEEIISPDLFVDAIKQADLFLAKSAEIETQLKETLAVSKDFINSIKVEGAESLKNQAKATNEATKALKDLEAVQQAQIKTEIAKQKLEIERQRVSRELSKSELEYNKQIQAEAAKTAKVQAEAAKELIRTKKEWDKLQKEEIKKQAEINSVYGQTVKKHLELSKAVMELSARGRENGVVFKAAKQELDALRLTLDKAEQGAGRFQRNVGNYASGFNGLNNSVNQLTREMPAFVNSMQTGFMAISNNLPIFFDELTKINEANEELIANGQPVNSLFKQLSDAVLSVGSVLSIGVTLLTVFGGKIIETVASLFEQKNSLEDNVGALKAYNDAIKESKKFQAELQKQIDETTISILNQSGKISDVQTGALKALEKQLEDEKKAFEMRNEQIGKYISELLINGDKEAKIKTTNSEKVISIENEKNGQIVRINKETGEIVGEYSAFYNKTSFSTTEEFAKKRINQINQEYKITQNLIKNNYNAQIKDEIEKEKERQKKEKEKPHKKIKELIDLTDRIRKLNIEDDKDEKQRAIEMALFEEETAIREVKKLNATQKQKQELIIAIQKDTFNKLADIEEKSNKDRDSAIKDDFKKTIEARQKIVTDNSDYELFLIEEKYKKEKEKGEKANKDELNRLQDLIIERKKLIIQQKADEEKINKNATEQLAIQNKANIDKDKLRKEDTDKAKKAQDTQLKDAMDFSSKLLEAVAKAEQRLSDLRVAGFEKQITDSEKNIETQRRLAERGLQNTLVEEEARKVQLERQKEEEKRAEVKRQKALAFFKLFSQYAERDPNTALAKALSETVIAEAIAGSFYTGTEGNKTLGDMLGRTGTKDGHLIMADDNERIFNPNDTAKLGSLTNKEVADLAYKAQTGLLDTAKYGAIPNGSFAENANNSALLMQTIQLNKRMQAIEQAIIDKPVTNFEFNQYGDFIKTQIENGFTKRTTYKQPKPRI